jgi:hypothetical protein
MIFEIFSQKIGENIRDFESGDGNLCRKKYHNIQEKRRYLR